ncbi:hypothetical protein [Brenneria goodwinii]|nr:hypothetical protein [Brenneria goodwinii]
MTLFMLAGMGAIFIGLIAIDGRLLVRLRNRKPDSPTPKTRDV